MTNNALHNFSATYKIIDDRGRSVLVQDDSIVAPDWSTAVRYADSSELRDCALVNWVDRTNADDEVDYEVELRAVRQIS